MTTAKMALPAAIALSGLNEEHFSDGLNDVYNKGAVLLKSPSLTTQASTKNKYSSLEIRRPSSERYAVVKNLGHLFNMMFISQKIELQEVGIELHSSPQTSPKSDSKSERQMKVMHQRRNVLDLAGNLKWKWDFKMANIKSGPRYFFENRSQYSRVLGAEIPNHVIVTCSCEDCGFQEPHYE